MLTLHGTDPLSLQDLLHVQSENQTLQQEVTSLQQRLEQVASHNKDKEAELKALTDEVDTLKKHSAVSVLCLAYQTGDPWRYSAIHEGSHSVLNSDGP